MPGSMFTIWADLLIFRQEPDLNNAIAIASLIPVQDPSQPPIVLVHGAANSAKVWRFWQLELASRGWASHAIDIRGHGKSSQVDLSQTSMNDYAADVLTAINYLQHAPVVMGWSMGGLIAMMVAAASDAKACIALAPSMPARARDGSAPLRHGEFGPEEYGIVGDDPEDQPSMLDLDSEERKIALSSGARESRLARDDRKAGIVLDSLQCPLLIVTGSRDTAWPRERYNDIWLKADFQSVKGASHWGLVLNRRILESTVDRAIEWLNVER